MVLADIVAALIGVRLGGVPITEPEAIRLAEKILEWGHDDFCALLNPSGPARVCAKCNG